ncbi:MAG: Ku protein [Pseudomonadota bacterium]|nr:Ku protein [Pseudomonadota bacterium]
MPRELWKGAIQFGLVHIPVSLFPAEQRDDLSFTMLDRRDLQPVGYKRFNKSTGDEVPYEEIVKGFEYEDGHFVTLEKEDFKRANVESTQTVEIVGFIDRKSLSPFFFEAPYYLAPGKHGDKGYTLLRETLVRTGRVGLATVVIRTREHIAALYAVDNVLVLNTLRYANELRDPKDLDVPGDLKSAKVTPKELDMAERLVEDMAIDWDPAKYHDTYRDDLMKLIEEKAAGKTRRAPKAKRAWAGAEVIDFAALLERSLTAKRSKAPAGKAVAARVRRKPTARAAQRRAA